MMNIYIPHSNSFNFKDELYTPIRKSDLNSKYNIVLPHENSDRLFNSKEYLKECDLVLAEVSFPSTGLGIELGWANTLNIPIICIYKSGTKPSNSIKAVSKTFIEYIDINEIFSKVDLLIQSNKK